MKLQPGVGYTFTNASGGASLIIDEPPAIPPHPFKVYAVVTSSGCIVRVIPGTINNIEPTIGSPPVQLSVKPPPTMNVGSASVPTYEYIYLQMPVATSGTPPAFPDLPTIMHDSSPQTSTDATAFLLLALVEVSTGTVSQYVSGSQWGERYKCGANDAVYFFGLV